MIDKKTADLWKEDRVLIDWTKPIETRVVKYLLTFSHVICDANLCPNGEYPYCVAINGELIPYDKYGEPNDRNAPFLRNRKEKVKIDLYRNEYGVFPKSHGQSHGVNGQFIKTIEVEL